MDSLHERLKEERIRLGLTQADFAEKGGVLRRAQVHYKSGERCPDGHYFAAIAAAGADVQYILVGIRAMPINERHKALIDNYENTDENGKRIIEATASAAAQPEPAKKRVGARGSE